MPPPSSSIPNYSPRPVLKYVYYQAPYLSSPPPFLPPKCHADFPFRCSRSRRGFLAAIILLPVGTYIYFKSREAEEKKQQVRVEEEGRRNWIQSENGKSYQVDVKRSGGGV